MTSESIVEARIARARLRYRITVTIWLLLGISTVILPLLAASSLFDALTSRVLALGAAICSALFAFGAPNLKAGEYHAEVHWCRLVLDGIRMGALKTPEKIFEMYIKPPGSAPGADYGAPAKPIDGDKKNAADPDKK